MPAELYRSKPILIRSVSNKESVVCLMDGFTKDIVGNAVSNLLVGYREFSTIDDYVKKHWKKTRLSERVHLINEALQYGLAHQKIIPFSSRPILDFLAIILNLFRDNGFLVSIDDFLKRSPAIHDSDPHGNDSESLTISTVGFVTKNRPNAVYRAVSSFIDHSNRFGRKNDFAVFDDSEGTETRDRLKSLPSGAGRVFYAGRKEKLEFIGKLTEEGIPQSVLEFLFFGIDSGFPKPGGNRNAFLLHVAGELAFCADDDVICRVGRSPSYRDGVKVGPDEMREQMWSFPDRQSAFASIPTVESDILAHHERMLGKPARSVIREYAYVKGENALDSAKMDGDLMDLISRGKSKVVLSVNGLVGDSGMSTSEVMVFASGETRKRFLESEASFKRFLTSRETIKATNELLLFRAGNIMGAFLGVDGRETIPPFFPMFRGEDGLFGDLIGSTIKGACFAFLPWVLAHDPEDHRHYGELDDGHGETLVHMTPIDVIHMLVSALGGAPMHSPVSENLKFIGSVLINYGAMPSHEFIEILNRSQIQSQSEELAHLLTQLNSNKSSPKFFKDEINRRVTIARQALAMPVNLSTPFIIDGKKVGADEGLKFIQKSISLFGDALIWWPQILSATKELKQKGIRLAQPL